MFMKRYVNSARPIIATALILSLLMFEAVDVKLYCSASSKSATESSVEVATGGSASEPGETKEPGNDTGSENSVDQPQVPATTNPEGNPPPTDGAETDNKSKKIKKSKFRASILPGRVVYRWDKSEKQQYACFFIKAENSKKWRIKKLKGNMAKYEPKFKEGKKYRFKIRLYDSEKNIIKKSKTEKIFIPKAPENITVSRGTYANINIRWKKNRLEKYIIYRKDKDSYKYLKKSSDGDISESLPKYDEQSIYKIFSFTRFGGRRYISRPSYKRYTVKSFVDTKSSLYTYEEMVYDLSCFQKYYPGYIKVTSIGKSRDGRELYDVILGNEASGKTMLVIYTVHAREYMCTQLGMNQIEYYLQNLDKEIRGKKVESILNGISIHMVVMANPDGITLCQKGINSIKNNKLRKNLLRMSKGVNLSSWKANAAGVDLNRNFPYKFKTEGKAGYADYPGKKVASEPEVKAIIKLTKTLKGRLRGAVNYHAMGEIIFGDC